MKKQFHAKTVEKFPCKVTVKLSDRKNLKQYTLITVNVSYSYLNGTIMKIY